TMTRPATRKPASAVGCRASAAATLVALAPRSVPSRSLTSPPRASATRNTPPTTGTASNSLNVDSATNCTTITGQLASDSTAPRLIDNLRRVGSMWQATYSTEKRTGGLEERRNGGMEEWRNGG